MAAGPSQFSVLAPSEPALIRIRVNSNLNRITLYGVLCTPAVDLTRALSRILANDTGQGQSMQTIRGFGETGRPCSLAEDVVR